MAYNPWTKIDSGREGLWKSKVWLGAIQIISKHEGEGVYDANAAVYAELEAKFPGAGWMKAEPDGSPRPVFRDYAKPWTVTGVLDLTGQKFALTPIGKQVADGRIGPSDVFQAFLKKWVENGERPFTHLSVAFLEAGGPLSYRDLYFGVMLGFRKGDDAKASIALSREHTEQMDETPRRRLSLLLGIMEAAGAIAKEDPKVSEADATWIAWNTALLKDVASFEDSTAKEDVSPAAVTLIEIVASCQKSFQASGLASELGFVRRFISALVSKRFCILTGLAGSGKTKLAEAFAMWLSGSDAQYRVVAVGADWTSNENLLGYADALHSDVYRLPANGVLDLILRASGDASNKPYFLILDEMNLSHVERYFADFLSSMESGNASISLHGEAGTLNSSTGEIPGRLKLPGNLFIIGTVNVDETTYMFSPKVLDRANVLEFRASQLQMDAFLDNPLGINLEALKSQGAAFASAFVQRASAEVDLGTLVDAEGNPLSLKLKEDMLALFEALLVIGAEFGFRTAKEISRFMVIHKELTPSDWQYKDALDAQVLQKLMPKLHGSARKLDGVLQALDAFATKRDLPLTREKIKRMQNRLMRDGFTSFAEA